MLLWNKCSEQTASPEQPTGRTKSSPTAKYPKQLRWQCPSCSPNFKLGTPRLHSWAACDRPETTKIPKFPPNPEVVWQQPLETITDQCNLNNTNNDSTIYVTHETSKTTVASQTSPPKGTQPQNYVVATEQPSGNQTGKETVRFLNCSKNRPTDIQNLEQHVTITATGDTIIPPPTTITPLIEDGLVRDELTNEVVYLTLTSTVVLKRKQKMLYVPPDFENNLMVDASEDSGAFVSAIAQNDLDTLKEKAPNNIVKVDDPLNFQKKVASAMLEKPLATASLEFEIRDNIFVEHFVMKKLTGPIFGLNFMRKNSIVIDTTHGLMHFPHLIMQLETASSETTMKPLTLNHWRCPDDTTDDNKNNRSLRWPTVKMEHNRHCDTIGESYGNNKFADFSLIVDNTWQKNSSQGNQYNGIIIYNQKAQTESRVLHSHSGAIQAH